MRSTVGIHFAHAKVMLMGSSMVAAMMVIAPPTAWKR